MIEHPLTDSIDHLDSHLSQELSQYRRVNFNLRRKLKEKDLKIWYSHADLGHCWKW